MRGVTVSTAVRAEAELGECEMCTLKNDAASVDI